METFFNLCDINFLKNFCHDYILKRQISYIREKENYKNVHSNYDDIYSGTFETKT